MLSRFHGPICFSGQPPSPPPALITLPPAPRDQLGLLGDTGERGPAMGGIYPERVLLGRLIGDFIVVWGAQIPPVSRDVSRWIWALPSSEPTEEGACRSFHGRHPQTTSWEGTVTPSDPSVAGDPGPSASLESQVQGTCQWSPQPGEGGAVQPSPTSDGGPL